MNDNNEQKVNNSFNIGRQTANRIINIGNDDRIKQLEQQVSDLETSLIITKNSRKHHVDENTALSGRISDLESMLAGELHYEQMIGLEQENTALKLEVEKLKKQFENANLRLPNS